MAHALSSKWENKSYPSIILGALPKLITAIPAIMELPYMVKEDGRSGLEESSGLLQLLGTGSGNEVEDKMKGK